MTDWALNRWHPEDLAYAAGFLDGEGCFTTKKGTHKIETTCNNTDRDIIYWFQTTFGGNVSRRRRSSNPKHRDVWVWRVTSERAWEVCSAIAPYLRVKTQQAILLIALQQTKSKRYTRGVPPEVKRERERLAALLKDLKHVRYE